MIYKTVILSLLVCIGVALLAFLLGWITMNTVIVMIISGVVGGVIAFQSAKSHSKTNYRKN